MPVTTLWAEDEQASKGDPDAVGHSADGNYWDLSPGPKVELPRIMITKSDEGSFGFDFFGSTKAAVESHEYVLIDKEGNALSEEEAHHAIETKHHLHFPIKPAHGNIWLDLSITRQLLFVFISAFILLIMALRFASKYRKGIGVDTAPKGKFQNAMEALVVYIRDNIANAALGDKADKYLPYLLTVFLFILLGNLIGLLPFGVTATSNISVTAALAVITFIMTSVGGTRDYWKHIFNPPGISLGVKIILVPIEFVSIFIKPLALAFRLFGNMVSGHLVILSILGMTFVFGATLGHGWGLGTSWFWFLLTVGIYLLKILVSFIQAYVFTMLSAIFIGMAVVEHDHHDDHAKEISSDHNSIVAAEELHLETSPVTVAA